LKLRMVRQSTFDTPDFSSLNSQGPMTRQIAGPIF
jgi:hypothetical protein